MKKFKIMQINAGNKNYGGVSAMIFEIFKNINKERFDFYFVSPMKTTYELKRKEIEELGGKIIELDTNGNVLKRKIQLFIRLRKIIEKEKFDIIHINSGNFFFNFEVAVIAKIMKVKKIIVHSHNAKNSKLKFKNLIANMLKPLLKYFATNFLTCSDEAAKAMFTNKMIKRNEVVMIPNGIETLKFKFDENVRKEYIKELKLENKFVIGNIGRFMEQKNHKFLIDVFYEYSKIDDSAILILIGEGTLKEEIKKYVAELNLLDKVMFLGVRNDIQNLLMCMDVFVMTSFHEGLPVVGVEAQASGLNLLLSDTITRQVKITNNVEFVGLSEGALKWAQYIKKIKNNHVDRKEVNNIVCKSDFDIKKTVEMIEEIYCK